MTCATQAILQQQAVHYRRKAHAFRQNIYATGIPMPLLHVHPIHVPSIPNRSLEIHRVWFLTTGLEQKMFSTGDRDADTPHIKQMRVVTTIDYSPED